MFEITTTPSSDSDSDCELPKYHLPCFDKYGSGTEETATSTFHNKSITLSSAINAGPNYNFKEKSSREKLMQAAEENLKECGLTFENLPPVSKFLSKKQRRKQGLKLRDKTKGHNWYDMPAPELTDEMKNDLMVIKMRQGLDPKHFYKRSATQGNPKYFQVGTIVESPLDFYNRVPKKQRKQNLVEELLADTEFRKYQKKKFLEIQQSQPKGSGHAKFARKNKTKKTKAAEGVKNNKKNFKKDKSKSKKHGK